MAVLIAQPVWAGASRDFNGTADNISWGDPDSIDSASSLSCTMWFYADDNDADMAVITKSESDFDGFYFYVDITGACTNCIRIFIGDQGDADTASAIGANGTGAFGSWRHMAFTYTSGSSTGLKIYLNGTQTGSSADTTSIGSINSNTTTLWYARSLGGAYFDGKLAYGSCWVDKVLTEAEINNEMWCPGSVPGALIFSPLWGNDSPEIDLSGNGNSGTVSGTSVSTDGPPVSIGCGSSL